MLAVQALLEFVAVIRRRRPQSVASAFAKVDSWCEVLEVAPTTLSVMKAARQLVNSHQFQVWDAVIWCAAQGAGAGLFLSEDLHDGLLLNGMRVVNPFNLSARDLDSLLA